MSKPECEIVSITGDHKRISLESAQPAPFSLSQDEIKHRIVQAYMRLVFRADNGRGSRTVSVTRSQNAYEVFELLQPTADVAAILTSVNMPGSMDSFEFARLVRQGWPVVGVIVISG